MSGTYTGPYDGPLPGAGGYSQYANSVNQAYQTAQAQVKTSRDQFLNQSGLTGEYGADGAYTGFQVSADNPTGAYQQMAQQNAQQGESDQGALGSLGFGGGLRKQLGEQAQNNYSDNAMKFASGVAGQLDPLAAQEQANTTQQTNSLTSGLVSDVTAAIQAGTFNPADYSGITIGGHSVDPNQIATGLGWKPGQGNGGVTAPTGSGNAQAHPFYAAWKAQHPNAQMSLAQWVAAGSPGRPNGKWNGH